MRSAHPTATFALQTLPLASRLHARRAGAAASTWPPSLAPTGRRRARAPVPQATALAGRQIGLLFEKPSLRTRVTFTIGVGELGGNVIDIPSDVMHADREPLHDVARNLERWIDAVVIRTFARAAVDLHRVGAGPAGRERALGRGASVPGAGRHADAARALGHVAGRTLAFVGDGNNVATSLVARRRYARHARARGHARRASRCRRGGRAGRQRVAAAAPSCRSSSIRARP